MTRYAVIVGLFFALLSAMPLFGTEPQQHYKSAPCAVEFDYPAGWVVVGDVDNNLEESGQCVLRVRPAHPQPELQNGKEVERDWITIMVGTGGLEDRAEDFGFEKDAQGDWTALGRGGAHSPTKPIRSSYWQGLTAEPVNGCYYKGGGYIGLCDLKVALVSDDTNTARLDFPIEAATQYEPVLKSFRFLKQQNK